MMGVDDSGEGIDSTADPRDAIEFKARVVPYSGIVGSSILLTAGDGPVVGQLALLCFGEKADQEYWAHRLARALNNGCKAEKAIAHMLARGLLKKSSEMPPGQGGPPTSGKPAVDVREFVQTLERAGREREMRERELGVRACATWEQKSRGPLKP